MHGVGINQKLLREPTEGGHTQAPTALAAPAGPPLALVVRGGVLWAMWGACGHLRLVWWPVWLRVDVQREPGGAWLQLHQRWRPLQLVPVKHICGGCQVDTQERS